MAEDVIIRGMEEKDLPEVACLEAETFTEPWSLTSLQDSIKNPIDQFLVAIRNGVVVGYCALRQVGNEGEISNVAVASGHQNQGIGKKMLEELLCMGEKSGITEYTLEVRISNESAIHLYQRAGFLSEGVRKNFYQKPAEDAVIMWKR